MICCATITKNGTKLCFIGWKVTYITRKQNNNNNLHFHFIIFLSLLFHLFKSIHLQALFFFSYFIFDINLIPGVQMELNWIERFSLEIEILLLPSRDFSRDLLESPLKRISWQKRHLEAFKEWMIKKIVGRWYKAWV